MKNLLLASGPEFLVHSNEEQGHADQLADRIVQLGGVPDFSPEGLGKFEQSIAARPDGGCPMNFYRCLKCGFAFEVPQQEADGRPRMDNQTQANTPVVRTLRRAVEALGTEDSLAEVLGVTPTVVAGWLSGFTVIPAPVYLKALDLVAHPVNPRYWTSVS